MATRPEGQAETQSREIHRTEINGIPVRWV